MHTLTHHVRRTLLGTMLGTACAMLAVPGAYAQAVAGGQPFNLLKRTTADAMAAAQRDLARFATHQVQRTGSPAEFPLDVANLGELKEAVISYGFPVHTIDPDVLLAGRGAMQQMVRPTAQWRFVITLRNRPVGMATVERVNGRYETVAYGGAVMSKDLDALAAQFGNADKSNLRFVRIYQARADFLEVAGNDGRAKFAPLHSARASLQLGKQSMQAGAPGTALVDETEIAQPLRAAVKLNMETPR